MFSLKYENNDYINIFPNISPALHSYNTYYLTMMNYLFNQVINSAVNILVKIFMSTFITYYHKLNGLTEMYSFTVQEAKSLKSRYWLGQTPSRKSRRDSIPCLSSGG